MLALFKDIKNIFIALLVVVVILTQFKNCNNVEHETTPTVVTRVDTLYKHIDIKIPVYVPKYVTRIKVDTVIIPSVVDTVEILKDYFSKYRVVDTLKLTYSKTDKKIFGIGIVTDTITQNKIVNRSVEWNYEIPIVEKTTTIYPSPKRQVFVGFNAGFNSINFVNSVAVGALYKNKRDNIYQLMFGGTSSPDGLTPTITGGIFWKIRLKKSPRTDTPTTIH